MERLTTEQIARQTDYIESNRANRTAINRLYRAQDESHLWRPIRGRFNVTDRAIRRVQKFMRESGQDMAGLEYCYAVEAEISNIVNGEL